MAKKSKKKRANIYMDSTGIYYVIHSKKDHINGKVLFDKNNMEEDNSYSGQIRKLRQEMKILKKRNKIKEFNIILTDGLRLVKVLKFEREIKLNNDVNLVLKDEISNFLQPSESVNDFELNYFKTGKKTQNIFLTSLTKRKPIIELCNIGMQDNVNIESVILPEIAMYSIIKDLNGVNIAVLYNEGRNELRTLVCKGSEFLYASQIGSVYKEDVEDEINKLDTHLCNQYKIIVNSTTVIGYDKEEEKEITFESDELLDVVKEVTKEQVDNRYLLLMDI